MKDRIWPTAMDGAGQDEAHYPGKDYSGAVVEFLQSVHGKIRKDDLGDYYYEDVSTISLHLLLGSQLPPKEILWAWYDYFDREHSESIYQTLPPLNDEIFLGILAKCDFTWDEKTVRRSGLVFLSGHRKEVYGELENLLTARLESHLPMDEAALREFLMPVGTWSDAHIRKEVRRLRTQPLTGVEKEAVYRHLESNYLRATARHLMDEVATEAFWKAPPPELEGVCARFKRLNGTLREESMRLGLYVSREAYEREHWQEQTRNRRRNKRNYSHSHPAIAKASEYFTALGLSPEATVDEVKAAYREKVKAHHPDQGGSVEMFLLLQEAYEYLLREVF